MEKYTFICESCGKEKTVDLSKSKKRQRFCCNQCKGNAFAGISFSPTKYVVTPEIHDLIKEVYQKVTGNGEVKKLAEKIKFPRWKVSRYAIRQGWLAKTEPSKKWTKEEINILESKAHTLPETISRALREKGFERSPAAVVAKRKKLRLLRNLPGQNATQLAECLGVSNHTVNNAISKGVLIATRRETKRTETQGGDMYFIKDADIKNYILENIGEIDLRKVDKYWFVDLVSDGGIR